MYCELYFPTPVWWDILDVDNNKIYNFCLDKKKSVTGRNKSNVNGWQSDDFLPGEIPELYLLQQEILHRCTEIISAFTYKTDGLKIYFLNMWINFNYPCSYNVSHIHDSSAISGVYYIKTPAESGTINFERNPLESYIIHSIAETTKANNLNSQYMSIQPEEKKLILFPSYVSHNVGVNNSKENRISISFNLGLKYD